MPPIISMQNLYQLILLLVMWYAWMLAKSRVPGIGCWIVNLLLNTLGLVLHMFVVQTSLPVFRIIANLFHCLKSKTFWAVGVVTSSCSWG